MDGTEIQIGQEFVGAVGQELVPGVRGGIAASHQHIDAGVLASTVDRLAHAPVEFAVAEHVGPPAGDGKALPGLVPEHEARDRSPGPAVLAGELVDESFVVVVLLGQPDEVLLAAFHDAVFGQMRPAASERFLGGTGPDLHDGGHVVLVHAREFLLQPRQELRVLAGVGGLVADAIADGLDAETTQNLRRHVLQRLLGILHPFVRRFERAHAGCQHLPAMLAEVHHEGIAALGFRDWRRDGDVLPALAGQVHPNRHRSDVADPVELRHPHLAGSAPPSVVNHVHNPLGPEGFVTEVLYLEREGGRLAGMEDVARRSGLDQRRIIRVLDAATRDIERFIEAGSVAGLAELEGGHGDTLRQEQEN